MSQTASAPTTRPAPDRQGLTLAVVLLAVFVVPTSISGTAVALPAIGADLHAGPAALQWVVNAFNVAFACCTLVWGTLADTIGRVRAFATGAAVFTAASLACAVTPNVYVLDAARAVSGVGGAAIFACGSAIISTAFDGAARAKAFALFGTVAGVGVALGPTVSGPAVDLLGWRWIFGLHAVALTLVLVCLPAVARTVGETRNTAAPRLDVRGAAVFVLAMLALTYAIVQGSQWGWTAPGTLGLLAAALVLLVLFTARSKRTKAPLLDLSVLRDKAFLAYCLVPVAASFGFVTQLTYLPTYLTTVAGHSPSSAGATMLLLTLPVLVLPLAGAKMVERGASARGVVLASLGFLVTGDLALLLLGPDTSTLVMAAPMLLTGAGMGLSAGLVDAQALALVEPAKAGMAAGFLNTLRLGSEAVAVAVFGSAVAGLVAGRQETGTTPAAAYDSAFHALLWAMAAVCAVLALVVIALGREKRRA